jgi:hypothetical protein
MPDPWFKFYSTEFLLDARVNALTLQEQAIVVRMWCVCHQTGAIPDDPVALARLIGVSPKTLRSCWDHVRMMFTSSPDHAGMIRSSRLDDERMRSEVKRKRQSEGANKTNDLRWGGGNRSASLTDRSKEEDKEEDGEKKEPKGSSSCAKPGKPAPAPDSSPVVMVLPCVGKGCKEWPITEATMAKWKEAFPGVDPVDQARRMKLWLEGNPTRQKTATGMARFALSWMGRAQDSAPKNQPHTPGAPNGSRSPQHRAGVDAAYQQVIRDRPAPAFESADDDPELRSLFEAGANP